MHRRIVFTFVTVLALCLPLAAGATHSDMDPNGHQLTSLQLPSWLEVAFQVLLGQLGI